MWRKFIGILLLFGALAPECMGARILCSAIISGEGSGVPLVNGHWPAEPDVVVAELPLSELFINGVATLPLTNPTWIKETSFGSSLAQRIALAKHRDGFQVLPTAENISRFGPPAPNPKRDRLPVAGEIISEIVEFAHGAVLKQFPNIEQRRPFAALSKIVGDRGFHYDIGHLPEPGRSNYGLQSTF